MNVEKGHSDMRARTSTIVLVAALLFAAPQIANAEYKLGPGDVVELSTTGQIEIKQRALVGIDGEAVFPVIGHVETEGLTLKELTSQLQTRLSSKLLRQRAVDGREYTTVLSPDQIAVTVAEYRPIYLMGDVSKPGELAFRPGLTVRQAVALAGGYDILRFRMNNPFLELADLKSESQTLWMEYTRKQAERARLQAELDGKTELIFSPSVNVPIPKEEADDIERRERHRFNARRESFAAEEEMLTTAIAKEEKRMEALADQQINETKGVEFDEADQKRVQQLFDSARVPITRAVDAKRTALLSATRLLQTIAQKGTVERQRDDIAFQLQKLRDGRREGSINGIADVEAQLATARYRIEAVGSKLMYTGMVKSQIVSDSETPVSTTIIRIVDGKREKLAADQEFELAPGDTVEVALQKSLVPSSDAASPQN